MPIWLLWLVPSLGQLVKHAGFAGVAGLGAVGLAGIAALLFGAVSGRLRPTTAWFVALCVVAIALFTVLDPLAQSSSFGGGPDRDDALNVALDALLA